MAKAVGMMNEAAKPRLTPLKQPAAPLRTQIIASLRKAIELGFLAPGTRLVEKDLCEQLGVSRTSLREALRELQSEGILEHTATRGLAVSAISREDATNVYRIRAVLEALIVEQFIEKADDGAVAALARDADALKIAYRSAELEQIVVAKRAFYDRICTGADNPVAFDIISRLILRTSSLRAPSLLRKQRQHESIKEIDALVRFIQQRDIAAARKMAAAHVDHAARSALGATDIARPVAKAGTRKKAGPVKRSAATVGTMSAV
jgi:DNA-binding GntR family transcriptional regulator